MKKTATNFIILIILLLISIIGGYMVYQSYQPNTDKTPQAQRKILYWVAQMDPSYKRDKPGKSPMGMDLVPVYADAANQQQGMVQISPEVENNLGVKIAVVQKQNMPRIINTVGYVRVDENQITHIHTYTDGWIKKLDVKTTAESVKQGQLLFELYSPTLINAQDEFLLAIKHNNQALIKAGEQKLLTLGMTQHQIDKVRTNQQILSLVNLYAPQAGIISKLNIREGMYVTPATELMTIEDLAHIWIVAQVYERQANWVKVGQNAVATLQYAPGKTWQGKVEYVYPQLDTKTHTLPVRLSFANPVLTLKPGMYANIKILSTTLKNVLTIPYSALIQTGDGSYVILALGNGRYQSRLVKTGIESGDNIVVLSGLKSGDRIVTSAQFLIDSESNLKASFSRLGQKPKPTNNNH